MSARLADLSVGDQVFEISRAVTREDVKAYADASGDQNPLHQDDEVARAAGFPGVIAHGMYTMGTLASAIVGWAGSVASLARMRSTCIPRRGRPPRRRHPRAVPQPESSLRMSRTCRGGSWMASRSSISSPSR